MYSGLSALGTFLYPGQSQSGNSKHKSRSCILVINVIFFQHRGIICWHISNSTFRVLSKESLRSQVMTQIKSKHEGVKYLCNWYEYQFKWWTTPKLPLRLHLFLRIISRTSMFRITCRHFSRIFLVTPDNEMLVAKVKATWKYFRQINETKEDILYT